nr:DUF4198 domain-containing protein [Oceanicola sp. 22II-s10i]
MILRLLAAACLLLPLLTTGGKAHEFWIEPEKYQVDAGGTVTAQLRNGQGFKGAPLSWFDRRNRRVEQMLGDDVAPITGRPGDIPALSVPADGDGLMVLVHESTATLLTYDGWDKVVQFVEHKNFPWFFARHAERGLPEEGVKEVYTRYSKALVGVGGAAGADHAAGLAVEFVALNNPYVDPPADGMRVRLLYQGAPLPDAQVEVYEKAAGEVTVTKLRTGEDGEVVVPIVPGHSYLLDHVVLREPDPDTEHAAEAMWESLWASMTFAVPAD